MPLSKCKDSDIVPPSRSLNAVRLLCYEQEEMMITYTHTLSDIRAASLQGFFVGWPNPPSPEAHLRILQSSDMIVLAQDEARVVGFITAISDGVLCAYI